MQPDAGSLPSLDDAQLRALERLGRRAELHFGAPQDLEWAIDRRRRRMADAVPADHHALPDAGAAAVRAGDAGLSVLQPGPGADPAPDADGTGRLSG